MLTIDLSKIPPDGLILSEALAAFALAEGGSLRGRLDKVDAGSIHLRGRLTAALGLECGRCLEPFTLPIEQDLDLFYLPHAAGASDGEEDEVELKDRDMVVAFYDGEKLDLGEVIREQFFLAVPLKPLCQESCRGRCPSCSVDRNTGSCTCTPETPAIDPRLAKLKNILGAARD